MADSTLKAADVLAVRSRVSWAAIAAGAMVALSVYFVLTLLGLAMGMELVVRRQVELGAGPAIYSIVVLLIAMFFGGWTTSRLAVGESQVEAVLYGIILWGVLFLGLLWMIGTGIRAGFGALVSGAVVVTDEEPTEVVTFDLPRSQTGADPAAKLGGNQFATVLKDAGITEENVQKVQDAIKAQLGKAGDAQAPVAEPGMKPVDEAEARQVMDRAAELSRRATWFALTGVLVSMVTVILGSLIGSGDLPVPVPVLGVRRPPRDPRM